MSQSCRKMMYAHPCTGHVSGKGDAHECCGSGFTRMAAISNQLRAAIDHCAWGFDEGCQSGRGRRSQTPGEAVRCGVGGAWLK